MTKNTTIVRVGIADLQVLRELSITTFCDAFAAQNKREDIEEYVAAEMNEHRLAAELANESNLFYFVYGDNTVAGYMKLREGGHPPQLAHSGAMELERLYVRRQWQGQRLGAALMSHALHKAAAHHCTTLWLGVWEHNETAKSFYARWGFTVVGAHIFTLGSDPQTDLLMKRDVLLP